jgi:signal transduction histidine kinase
MFKQIIIWSLILISIIFVELFIEIAMNLRMEQMASFLNWDWTWNFLVDNLSRTSKSVLSFIGFFSLLALLFLITLLFILVVISTFYITSITLLGILNKSIGRKAELQAKARTFY